nr:hypothetical protein [uncultured Methanospirillum sp.]
MSLINEFWIQITITYLLLVLFTLIPLIKPFLMRVELHPINSTFPDSPFFSDKGKERLQQHYDRLIGTLKFWKNQAEKYRRFHYYCIFWSVPITITVPILIQYIDQNEYSRLFLTIITTHLAILLTIHRTLKIENNYKSFRNGESEFYDVFRRLLDRPHSFGKDEDEQLDSYFKQVEIIREYMRRMETDNFPTLEEIKSNL